MKPFKRTLIDLFGEKRRYIIPLYQRKYAWKTDPQLSLLWDDILRSAEQIKVDRSKLTEHFVGAMVIAQKSTFGTQVATFEVIDGQQRLTTIQLLLAAFRDAVKDQSPEYGAEVGKYLLNDGLMENPETERFKLWPTITDRRSFALVVDPNTDVTTPMFEGSDDLDVEKLSVSAYEFFKEKIEDYLLDEGDLDGGKTAVLFEAMKDFLAVVSIELEDGDDPQTIFETLNSRGVNLSQSDLIRNMIFQRAAALDRIDDQLVSDRFYKKYWLPLDLEFWSEDQSKGRITHSRLEFLLADHLTMKRQSVISTSALANSYKVWAKDNVSVDAIEEELGSIQLSAGFTKRMLLQNTEDPLGRFGKVANAFEVSTAAPLVLYLASHTEDESELTACLENLESFIVRRDICRLTTKNYNRYFVEVIGKLKKRSGNMREALVKILMEGSNETNRWPDDGSLGRSFISEKQYRTGRQKRLVYMFSKIETHLKTKFSENIEISSELTIEHIMPQNWVNNWPLPIENSEPDNNDLDGLMEKISYEALETARNDFINTFGNLTLLTQKLNSSISNGAFEVKMPAILRQSSLELNRQLQEISKWDEEAIGKRSVSIFRAARSVWPVPAPISTDTSEPVIAAQVQFKKKKIQRLKDGSIRVIKKDGSEAKPTKDALRKITDKLGITPDGYPNTRTWGKIVIEHLKD